MRCGSWTHCSATHSTHGQHVGAYAVAVLEHPLPWTNLHQVYRAAAAKHRRPF
jgi:hypothetical protein